MVRLVWRYGGCAWRPAVLQQLLSGSVCLLSEASHNSVSTVHQLRGFRPELGSKSVLWHLCYKTQTIYFIAPPHPPPICLNLAMIRFLGRAYRNLITSHTIHLAASMECVGCVLKFHSHLLIKKKTHTPGCTVWHNLFLVWLILTDGFSGRIWALVETCTISELHPTWRNFPENFKGCANCGFLDLHIQWCSGTFPLLHLVSTGVKPQRCPGMFSVIVS